MAVGQSAGRQEQWQGSEALQLWQVHHLQASKQVHGNCFR